MDNEKDLYIIAMKYGVDNLGKQINYTSLIQHLKSKNIVLSPQLERYFHVWFYESFYVETIYAHLKDFKWTSGTLNEDVLNSYNDKPAILTGNSHQMYLDAEEIRLAFKSSKQARSLAITAILVTIVVGLAQIAISMFSTC